MGRQVSVQAIAPSSAICDGPYTNRVVREPGFGGWRGLLATLAIGLFVAPTWSLFQRALAEAPTPAIGLLLTALYVSACFVVGVATALILGWAQNHLRR